MPATDPSPETVNPKAEDAVQQPPPTPDEDGPHDVPDDKVIEKTMPTVPVGGADKPG